MSEVGVARADWCRCAGVSNSVDGDFAGDFASLVTAHSVGDHEKEFTGVPAVLILLTHYSRVGGETDHDVGFCGGQAFKIRIVHFESIPSVQI